MRHLVVMRHAKAEAYGATDAERPLAARGRADAAAAGRWLAGTGVRLDRALVSSAARTVATWEELRQAAGSDAEADVRDDLYLASPEDVLRAVRELSPDCRGAVYVGHNPTAGVLAAMLAEGEAGEAVRAVTGGFWTAALAVFEVSGDWADVGPGPLRLVDAHVGRG